MGQTEEAWKAVREHVVNGRAPNGYNVKIEEWGDGRKIATVHKKNNYGRKRMILRSMIPSHMVDHISAYINQTKFNGRHLQNNRGSRLSW